MRLSLSLSLYLGLALILATSFVLTAPVLPRDEEDNRNMCQECVGLACIAMVCAPSACCLGAALCRDNCKAMCRTRKLRNPCYCHPEDYDDNLDKVCKACCNAVLDPRVYIRCCLPERFNREREPLLGNESFHRHTLGEQSRASHAQGYSRMKPPVSSTKARKDTAMEYYPVPEAMSTKRIFKPTH